MTIIPKDKIEKRASVVKIMERRQVVIPKGIFEEAGLKVGDYLEAKREKDKIVYIPKQLVDRDSWYWSEEGQKNIGKALEDIKQGKVIGPFDKADKAVKALRKAKP